MLMNKYQRFNLFSLLILRANIDLLINWVMNLRHHSKNRSLILNQFKTKNLLMNICPLVSLYSFQILSSNMYQHRNLFNFLILLMSICLLVSLYNLLILNLNKYQLNIEISFVWRYHYKFLHFIGFNLMIQIYLELVFFNKKLHCIYWTRRTICTTATSSSRIASCWSIISAWSSCVARCP